MVTGEMAGATQDVAELSVSVRMRDGESWTFHVSGEDALIRVLVNIPADGTRDIFQQPRFSREVRFDIKAVMRDGAAKLMSLSHIEARGGRDE